MQSTSSKLPEPEWLDLPVDQWPPAAKHAYFIVAEWRRRLAGVSISGLHSPLNQPYHHSKPTEQRERYQYPRQLSEQQAHEND